MAQLVENRLQCGTPGFDPWVGRFPGEGKGYPFQHSGLETSMDSVVHGAAKSWSDFHFTQRPDFGAELARGEDILRERTGKSEGTSRDNSGAGGLGVEDSCGWSGKGEDTWKRGS